MRLLVVLVVLVAVVGPSTSGAAAESPRLDRADLVAALDVLHGWDARRSRAWAREDEKALRSLYLPGSAARSDVRLLRSYAAHGLVVRRMVTQVFGLVVIRRDPGRLTVRVLDRVAGGQVVGDDRTLALPSSRPVVRRIEFLRAGGMWRVARVTR